MKKFEGKMINASSQTNFLNVQNTGLSLRLRVNISPLSCNKLCSVKPLEKE